LSDYGAEVEVEVPPASETTDLFEMLESMGDALGDLSDAAGSTGTGSTEDLDEELADIEKELAELEALDSAAGA
ncbi:hypothetical protein NGM37_15130, partial [Streptomyces sp. TRM76130]|nr:hypothetical protein [Streptomyces sp. TRM76130]